MRLCKQLEPSERRKASGDGAIMARDPCNALTRLLPRTLRTEAKWNAQNQLRVSSGQCGCLVHLLLPSRCCQVSVLHGLDGGGQEVQHGDAVSKNQPFRTCQGIQFRWGFLKGAKALILMERITARMRASNLKTWRDFCSYRFVRMVLFVCDAYICNTFKIISYCI